MDTVVVGSGIGGLVAALACARAGQRVLVLEQHYLPGGWTQSFTLQGYRFSPGVHYVGDCGRGQAVRTIFEGLGTTQDGGLAFCEMNPDGFDHVMVGAERFDIPKGQDRYVERLCERFPREERGIRRYMDICAAIARDVARVDALLSFPRVLGVPFVAPELLLWGMRTHGALLDRTIRDPLLRDILTAQSGNHALAPSRVSLAVHAVMVMHYARGAFYPRGGAKAIPAALIKQLRKHGGRLRLSTRVCRVLVEGERAVGVELEGGERLRAPSVIVNADPGVAFGKLVTSPHGRRERTKLRRMRYSPSMMSVFTAVDMDLAALGFDSGNYWWYRRGDVGAAYERMEDAPPCDRVDALFLAITTLKDPSHRTNGRHHTIEMFTFLPWASFAKWANTTQGDRGEDYVAWKEHLGDLMLEAAEHVIPGLRAHVVFRNVGTPLSNDFYCETPQGAAYGTRKSPWQMGPFSFPIQTSVPGLYCCGASTLGHGVAGAAISGLMAASKVLHTRSIDDLLAPEDGSMALIPAEAERMASRPAP